MAIKKIKIGSTEHELQTTIANVDGLQAALDGKAASSHNHAASNITSGTLSSDRLPTVPIAKGGTGATTAAAALTNLGITATATELNKLDGVTATTDELNYVDGVTSNIQTQLNAKVPTSRTVNGKALSSNITLSASDVGADLYVGSSAPSNTENILWVDTSVDESDLYYTKDETDVFLATKAPAGYGLGVNVIPQKNDVNELRQSGWYWLDRGTTNSPDSSKYVYLRVDNFDTSSFTQTAYIVDTNRSVLQRSSVYGTLGEWEWVNPPMIPNVEYRTTERYNGKTVYVKLINFGAFPNTNYGQVEWAVPATPSQVVSVSGIAAGATSTLTIPSDTPDGIIRAYVNQYGHLYVHTTFDASGFVGYITIKYTKD